MKIKYFRIDNGLEYRDKKLEDITRHFIVKGTPQRNGVAERMNRTFVERAKCMRLNTVG